MCFRASWLVFRRFVGIGQNRAEPSKKKGNSENRSCTLILLDSMSRVTIMLLAVNQFRLFGYLLYINHAAYTNEPALDRMLCRCES